jgi:hypothetical protein
MAMEINLSKQKKILFCLVLKHRLSTRALLRRRNMHLSDYNCVFCTVNVEEDLDHLLLFHCPFAMACWFNLDVILPNTNDILIILESIRDQLRLSFFTEIIITMSWAFGLCEMTSSLRISLIQSRDANQFSRSLL